MMKKNRKKIVFFSGARSEYYILEEIIKKISKQKNIESIVYVTGIHMLKNFGSTRKETTKLRNIKTKRFFKIFKKNNNYGYLNLIMTVKKITKFLKIDKPNSIYILGDRFESMSAAIAAYFNNIPVIHCGGGDVTTGSKDDVYRNIISSVSSINFSTSLDSYKKLKKKYTSKIIFSGSPMIKKIYDYKKKKNNLKLNNFALMTFHPATNSDELVHLIMDKTINYLVQKKIKIVITYPNNEKNHEKILMIIKKVSKYPGVFIFKNLSNNYFNYLDNCLFVIGNTSSGIFDAPYFNKVFINIGYRQEGRKTDTNVFSTGTNFFKIKKYIDKFQYEYKAANNKIFGDKNSLDIQVKNILQFVKKN